MRRMILAVVILILSLSVMYACSDRIITFEQLPDNVKTLIKQNFATKVPLIVKADWDEYEVIFESGEKLEFDKKGNWKEFDCRYSAVPAALIPKPIQTQIQTSYPGAEIVKLKRDRRGYEVKLTNGLEVEFNKNFVIVDIDD